MIWVIGAKGMLGQEICRQLEENKIEFTGTDIELDFTDEASCASFAQNKSISYIINCAAYTAVDKAESDQELAAKLNIKGPEVIARLAKKIGATLIHISTDYVFDGTGSSPYTEETPVKPIGVYGVTKADGEKAVRENCDKYYILRTAWLYGWKGKNFVYTIIRAINTHDSIKVVNDQRGTPTFACDLAAIILSIIEQNKNASVPYGTYHCTDLGEITWYDFALSIKTLGEKYGYVTNKTCTVNPCSTEEYPTPAKRPAYSVLDKTKIQKALNKSLPDWEQSLEAFISSPLFDEERIK